MCCGEIDDGGLIERRERTDEFFSGVAHLVSVTQDAGACVDDERNARGLRRGVEIGNGLGDSVLEDLEILAGEAEDRRAVRSGNGAGDGNHLGAHLNRWRRDGRVCRAGAGCRWRDRKMQFSRRGIAVPRDALI